ncbi:MAG: hypothetical protein LR001_06235 [Clostridiales bacterium]|nr:hypothetical protein [Clostridiales bacterium]
MAILILCAQLVNESNQDITTMSMRPLVREIEKTVVVLHVRNYDKLETENFIIRYKQASAETAEKIMKIAEADYVKLTKVFGISHKEKIVIVLYDGESIKKSFLRQEGNLPLGLYYSGSVYINVEHLIENEWSYDTRFCLENTVLHELVHLFTDVVGNGNFPTWFTEGVSLYFEYQLNGYEWGREVGVLGDDYSISKLEDSFYDLNQHLAYTQSFRIVRNFVDERGVVQLVELISKLGEGEKLEEHYNLFN